MTDLSFATPLALVLLPLPLLAYIAFPRRSEPMAAGLYVPPGLSERLDRLAASGASGRMRIAVPAIIWVLLVVALAGPQTLTTTGALPVSGRSIVLSVDLSGSMEKEDFFLDGATVSRLDAVKGVARTFIRRRAGDRVGLAVFAKAAYFAVPLTFDVEAVARALDTLTIGISGRSTAISQGLGLAIKRLAAIETNDRVVVLLSDGVNTASGALPADVAALANRKGVRVYTIALGPEDLESAPDARDAVDSATLRVIAETSGGQMFRVRTTEDLQAVAATIDRLEPSLSDHPPLQAYLHHWQWLAGAAVILALLGFAADVRRR